MPAASLAPNSLKDPFWLIYVVLIKYPDQKKKKNSTREERIYLALQFQVTVPSLRGSQIRNSSSQSQNIYSEEQRKTHARRLPTGFGDLHPYTVQDPPVQEMVQSTADWVCSPSRHSPTDMGVGQPDLRCPSMETSVSVDSRLWKADILK